MAKYTKIEITIEDNGKRFKKLVEGGDAALWTEYMLQVCIAAEEVGKNPQWHLLRWKKFEIDEDGNPKTKSLVDQILEGAVDETGS